ncbi:hypothetical protein HYH03_018165 [Edaphochlamys debaryana]|uniref:Uncharacterized protein n=1 Tax=Edaphochlamys debaryana TaxID=47281 RepID=A0A835XGJ3_9CHLO|nr:hypothetical protein HYH03_018165 [Edaphochlamys debaryana]|eukprot:KAG2482940.1 hypothetical protein HYH03_018165 [Edaphochlamys debaryana]
MAGKRLRVCVLQSSVDGCKGALASVDPYRKPEAYDTAGEFEWSHVYIQKATSAAQLVELAASGRYDVYLNLCDGAWDEDRAGRDVVEALERLNLPYTGANVAFYEPTKVEMKMCAQYYGVQVPPWVHIASPSEVEAGLAAALAPPSAGGLRFPLIAKHPSGYSSVGMSRESKVADEGELRKQVSLLVSQFGGALVEEFIPGREFTVLVVEEKQAPGGAGPGGSLDPDAAAFRPVAYPPIECAFAEGEDFKHFDLKWTDYDSLQWRPLEGEPELAERLRVAACDTFTATRGVSYGRCDFRLDPHGGLWLLEINPQCGVLYPPGQHGSADFILALDPSRKHDHMAFIRSILDTALERHRRKQRKVAPRFFRRPAAGPTSLATANGHAHGHTGAEANGNGQATATANGHGHGHANGGNGVAADLPPPSSGAGGWGLVALVPIRAGEVVQRNEQRPHVIASRGFVQRCWPPGSRQREWFDAYAYPLNDQLSVTWSDDPSDWRPINHSCDPNTQLRGLDAVARRDIAAGEQLTIDYATFCTEHMAPFDCECGARGCRGRVTGQDHLAPWLGRVYGSHVSAWVAAKRAAAGLPVEEGEGEGATKEGEGEGATAGVEA